MPLRPILLFALFGTVQLSNGQEYQRDIPVPFQSTCFTYHGLSIVHDSVVTGGREYPDAVSWTVDLTLGFAYDGEHYDNLVYDQYEFIGAEEFSDGGYAYILRGCNTVLGGGTECTYIVKYFGSTGNLLSTLRTPWSDTYYSAYTGTVEDNDVLLFGTKTSDFGYTTGYLMKLDRTTSSYAVAEITPPSPASSTFSPKAIAILDSTYVLVGGYGSSGLGGQPWFCRISASLTQVLWSNYMDLPGNAFATMLDVDGNSDIVIMTADTSTWRLFYRLDLSGAVANNVFKIRTDDNFQIRSMEATATDVTLFGGRYVGLNPTEQDLFLVKVGNGGMLLGYDAYFRSDTTRTFSAGEMIQLSSGSYLMSVTGTQYALSGCSMHYIMHNGAFGSQSTNGCHFGTLPIYTGLAPSFTTATVPATIAISTGALLATSAPATGHSSNVFHVCADMGISEVASEALHVSPNPTSGLISIRPSRSGTIDGDVQIFSLDGKSIWRRTTIAPLESLDVAFLADGVYVLRTGAVGKYQFNRLVVQH